MALWNLQCKKKRKRKQNTKSTHGSGNQTPSNPFHFIHFSYSAALSLCFSACRDSPIPWRRNFEEPTQQDLPNFVRRFKQKGVWEQAISHFQTSRVTGESPCAVTPISYPIKIRAIDSYCTIVSLF